jgi:hypothetical protein
MESAGFKEWSLVCDALGRTPIGNFAQRRNCGGARRLFISASRVLLFPTFFHEQTVKVRIAAADIPAPGNTVAIRWYAKVERELRINSLAI